MFPQADTSATSLWYGHSPVSGMAPAGTCVLGCLLRSPSSGREILLGRFLEKGTCLASQFIYHVCRDHRLGIFQQPDHTYSHRKKCWSHVLDWELPASQTVPPYMHWKSGLILMIISVISCRPGLYQYFKRLARRNTTLPQ